jgi:replicative DNA helicase
VIAISSFNRQNYAEEVSFESFKESGSVEYSVDVLIGLQLFIKEREEWNKSTTQTEKRQVIDEAKVKNPREVELVILKNRIYKTGQSVFFKYYSAYDYFTDENYDELYKAKKEMDMDNDEDCKDDSEKENKEEYGKKFTKNDKRIQIVPKRVSK